MMASATPSSSAARRKVVPAAKAASAVRTARIGMVFIVSPLNPNPNDVRIVSNWFVRCQHILGNAPRRIYKTLSGL